MPDQLGRAARLRVAQLPAERADPGDALRLQQLVVHGDCWGAPLAGAGAGAGWVGVGVAPTGDLVGDQRRDDPAP